MQTTGTAALVAAPAILFVLLVVGLGLAASSDIEEAERAEAQYCEGVRDGWHEHYRREIECEY